jgi:deoxyribonuclease V
VDYQKDRHENTQSSFFAAVIVLDYESMAILEERTVIAEATFPYIPGLLSFREGPALLSCFEKLQIVPDAVIFDGQGTAHPRGIGLASHMGLLIDRPAIGCGKTRLCGIHDAVGDCKGDFAPLIYKENICGAAVKTKPHIKPVYISPGHKIGLPSAMAVSLACCRGYRLPEPVRKAHLLVNEIRKDHVT